MTEGNEQKRREIKWQKVTNKKTSKFSDGKSRTETLRNYVAEGIGQKFREIKRQEVAIRNLPKLRDGG